MIIFWPWRRLLQAGVVSLVGSFFLYAALHSPPHSEQAVRMAWGVGTALEMLALWLAWIALRWIWAGTKIFFRGPQ